MQTDFAAMLTNDKLVWSRKMWSMARNLSFINQFAGTGSNAMVQRITELTKTERGLSAVITLIGDLVGDGVRGDELLKTNEEKINAYDRKITIDQLRNANITTGKLADQATIINFRETSRDQLAYWLADRMDQLAFLTIAGEAYTQTNKGAARTSSTFGNLLYASDVSGPSTLRHLRLDASVSPNGALAQGDTSLVEAADTLSYRALVEAKAYAKDTYMRGIKGPGGSEMYHCFVTPRGMARLKLDPDFLANVRNAGVRGGKNPLFAGTESIMVDGLMVHEYRHVYNNVNAGASARWGASSDVDGQRVAICGAQAMAMADIGHSEWNEESEDYENQHGIGIAKMFGLLKPVFHSNVSDDDQDFGVLSLDTAI